MLIRIESNGEEVVYDKKDLTTIFLNEAFGLEILKTKEDDLIQIRDGVATFETAWTLVKSAFTEAYYQTIPDYMVFLQKLQKESKSVVDLLISECKGFDQNQLSEWFSKRTDAELEELGSFGQGIVNCSRNELNFRYSLDEEDCEEEYDEE